MRNYRLLILAAAAAMAGSQANAAVTIADVIGDTPLYGYFLDETSGMKASWQQILPDGTVQTLCVLP